MSDSRIIYKEEQIWKGKSYITEYVDIIDFTTIEPITQVQAICMNNKGQFVVYQDNEGHYGLPGGTVEEETLEEALRREVMEEVSCIILDFKPLLYLRNTNPPDAPIKVTFQVRYFAHVTPFSESINDPAGKSIRRVLVNGEKELKRLLGWGKKLDIYTQAARKYYE